MNSNLTAFYDYWRSWFAQPDSEKAKHAHQTGKGGWYPRGAEGPGLNGQKDESKEYAHIRLRHFETGGWLGGPEGEATEDLFWQCWGRAGRWLEDRDLDEIVRQVRPEDCVLRILHYFPSPTEIVGQAHRDFDLLTVSVEGTAPGLEVYENAGGFGWSQHCDAEDGPCGCGAQHGPRWIPQEEGIQVGEMLEIYSAAHTRFWNGGQNASRRFRATTHRVRTAPNTERFKAVFFCLPPGDFELRPGFTANDYLYGPNGVLRKAGTYK